MRPLILALALLGALGAHAQQPFVFSPYQHLSLAIDRDTYVITTAVNGKPQPVVSGAASMLPAGANALTWAFAIGECGQETWNGLDAQKVADANVAAFDRAGIGYILSTGGEGGVFTCGSDAGMEAFIARHASPRLIGIDFDIEARQTPEMIDALVQRAVAVRSRHPRLRLSFTLPTLAASDGSQRSLVEQGERVLQSIRRHGLHDAVINLMVMDYGPAQAGNCVVKNGACDMAQSAMQAALNLHRKHGVPLNRIELTPMIGVNDVADNVFGLDDATRLARWAREQGLAGLHFWSLDRDAPCAEPTREASALCSSLPGAPPPLAFTRAMRP
jgi:chitinase